MSAEPSVQVEAPIPEVVVIPIAILAALGIGFFWWRAAGKQPAA
jgi:hypothetical protein